MTRKERHLRTKLIEELSRLERGDWSHVVNQMMWCYKRRGVTYIPCPVSRYYEYMPPVEEWQLIHTRVVAERKALQQAEHALKKSVRDKRAAYMRAYMQRRRQARGTINA